MKVFRPFVLIGALLMASLACSLGSSGSNGQQSQPTQGQGSSTSSQSTSSQSTSSRSTSSQVSETDTPEAASGAQDYFTDEFDNESDISNYTYFNMGTGSEDNMGALVTKDGYMVFDLHGPKLWIYVTYDPYTYSDVRLDLKADNRGKNNNNVSLICRYSDEGWYEFNIANNGLYDIYAYVTADKRYYRIYNGGSNAIKQGKGINEYTAICQGNKLTLGVNGVQTKTIADSKYVLPEGKVGFGVSSFDVTPILVNIDSFQISEP